MLFIMPNDVAVSDKKAKNAEEPAEDFDLSDYSSGDTDDVSEEILLEMIKAGLWYGRNRTKTHPKMRPYIFTNRTGIEIIDIAKTSQACRPPLAHFAEAQFPSPYGLRRHQFYC